MANDPSRRGARDLGHGEPVHGSTGSAGSTGSTQRPHGSTAQGTATISRGAHPVQAEPVRRAPEPPQPPHRPKISPWLILGLLGLLALGGLITGLVLSHNPVTHVAPRVPHPPVGAGRTLSVFAQHGSGTSSPYAVPSSPVRANYGYQCPAGVHGHFIARMVNTDGSDVQNIVNSQAGSGNMMVTLHPMHPGSQYHTMVTAPSSTCGYRISVATPH